MFFPQFISLLMTQSYMVMFVLAIGRIAYSLIWMICQNGKKNGRCHSVLMIVNVCMWGSYHRSNYSIGGVEIKNVEAEKDLGVTTDCTLDSSLQCAKVVSTANKVLIVIMITYVYKLQGNILYLYKSLVRPHFEYCHQV